MLKNKTSQAVLSEAVWLLHTPADLGAAPVKAQAHCRPAPFAQLQKVARQMLKPPALLSPTVLVLWLLHLVLTQKASSLTSLSDTLP